MILLKWTHDIPSFYHAYQIRKGKKIKRNKSGVIEIYSIRYLYNIIAKNFGEVDKLSGLPSLSLDQLEEVLFIFEPVLRASAT